MSKKTNNLFRQFLRFVSSISNYNHLSTKRRLILIWKLCDARQIRRSETSDIEYVGKPELKYEFFLIILYLIFKVVKPFIAKHLKYVK